MVRIIGAVLLLSTSSMLGFSASRELKERVRDLEMMVVSFEFMERELKARLPPLQELLRLTSCVTTGCVKLFYLLVISRMDRQQERPFSQLWREAAEAAQLHITDHDLQILCDAGNVLGRYDAVSQCSALEEMRARLLIALKDAREQKNNMGRVYSTLGIASGALLSIILL